MRNEADEPRVCEVNTAIVSARNGDNYHLAALLNPLLERQQYRICSMSVACCGWARWSFVLEIFAESCARNGGFQTENVGDTLGTLLREFGLAELMRAGPG